VIALADAIPDVEALTMFDISKNELMAEVGKALAEALNGNQVMTELNIGSNKLAVNTYSESDMSGVNALADVIPGMGALSSLNVTSNNLGALVLPEGWSEVRGFLRGKSYMHTDGRKRKDDPSQPLGVINLANAIKDMGWMMSLHVGNNDIPEKEMKEIIAIAMSKESMRVLCEVPIKNTTLTKLDVSNKNLGAEGAFVVADYLRNNSLLTSLNLSSNNLKAKGANIVADAIKVTNCAILLILVPFSCLSYLTFNCRCLRIYTGQWGAVEAIVSQ
jgi:hypothetical protein